MALAHLGWLCCDTGEGDGGSLLIVDWREDLIIARKWELFVCGCRAQLGQQVLHLRFQVFGVFLCDIASHVKSNLHQLNKQTWLFDGAEDRSPHLTGLESGVGGENVHICILLVPRCLIWSWWHWR